MTSSNFWCLTNAKIYVPFLYAEAAIFNCFKIYLVNTDLESSRYLVLLQELERFVRFANLMGQTFN